jgi:steroid delta-isomerase-like uncharacterized protein
MKLNIGLVGLLISCSNQNDTNLAATKKLYESFNSHNWKEMTDLYADDAEFLDPSFGKDYVKQTKAQIVEKYSSMEQMFPDMHDDVKEMYVSDDKVIVQFVATGNTGDSIKLNLPICSILTYKDGKIVRDATYYDN